MIPFNIQQLKVESVIIKQITKSGLLTKVDSSTVKIPAAIARSIINRYKCQKFEALPLITIAYCGEFIDVLPCLSTSRNFFKEEVTSYEEIERLASASATRVEGLIGSGLRQGEGLEFTNFERLAYVGDSIVAYDPNFRKLSEDGKFKVSDARKIRFELTKLHQESGKVLQYTTPLGTQIECFLPNSALLSSTEYHAKDRTTSNFDQMCEKITPSVSFFIRAVYEWSQHFDDTIFEKMPVAELLLHFGAPNLLALPTEVRSAAPTGFDMKNMIVWSLSFYSKAKDSEQLVKLQKVVASLMQGKGGFVWKQDLNTKAIYKDNHNRMPELKKLEGTKKVENALA